MRMFHRKTPLKVYSNLNYDMRVWKLKKDKTTIVVVSTGSWLRKHLSTVFFEMVV